MEDDQQQNDGGGNKKNHPIEEKGRQLVKILAAGVETLLQPFTQRGDAFQILFQRELVCRAELRPGTDRHRHRANLKRPERDGHGQHQRKF